MHERMRNASVQMEEKVSGSIPSGLASAGCRKRCPPGWWNHSDLIPDASRCVSHAGEENREAVCTDEIGMAELLGSLACLVHSTCACERRDADPKPSTQGSGDRPHARKGGEGWQAQYVCRNICGER